MIEPGRMLSHYRIVEKIGEGGMGVVWKAFDTKLRRHIALKVLPPELIADPERRRRFVREARAAAAVTHPNIVTIYEIGEIEGITFISMELVEGRTLHAVLGGRPMPIPEALRVAGEIAEGLARAHQNGIVHRDLKPDNVILGADGHAKVLDFGLAKLVEQWQAALHSQPSQDMTRTVEMTQEGTVLGTAAYMSPEQARGEVVDTRSDIFSFGVVLYELVTGRVPFRGQNRIETLASILHEPAAPASRLNTEVPFRLEEVLSKCLDKEPAARYQSTQDLVVDLRRLGRDLHLGAAPSPEEARNEQIADRRLWVAVLPFQSLSAEGSHAYFAGGLHDELLTQLSKVAALKVISRTSVMGYQGTTKPLKQIAGELGVGSVVEGSVQVVGERLRVNMQLIDASTDEHLWAERYDRTLDDAFAIQSEVAQHVVTAVGGALTSVEQGRLAAMPTENAEAYRLYLQGREYFRRPGLYRQDREVAQQLYELALGMDPNFALAHAALSLVHGQMYWFRLDPSPVRAARQREEAEVALRLAPDLPQAHIAMGIAHYWGHRDYHRALDELTIALKGLPNDAELWRLIGAVHRRLGNWNEVFAAFEKAAQLDPRDADLFWDLFGYTYQFMRRYADAVRMYDRALSLVPDLHVAAIWRGWAFVLWQGQLDTLRAALNRVPRGADLGNLGGIDAQRAALLLRERDADSLLKMLQTAHVEAFESQDFFLPSALYAAWAHQLRGDQVAARAEFDTALALLDSARGKDPDDWRVHSARGMTLAGLGRREEAQQEVRWLQQSVNYREDAMDGLWTAEDRVRIMAQAGDAGGALDEIEGLLTRPSFLTVHTLRLDPRWDPIREHPRFKALLAKYSSDASS